jgi:hypothetical protein
MRVRFDRVPVLRTLCLQLTSGIGAFGSWFVQQVIVDFLAPIADPNGTIGCEDDVAAKDIVAVVEPDVRV